MRFHTSAKKGLVLLASATLLFGAFGCGKTDTAEKTSGYPVEWSETLDGETVSQSVSKAPTHAVSLSQATSEMLLQLGLEGSMVGTAMKEEPIYDPLVEAYDKVHVLAEKEPSFETFMAAEPDFVTGWGVDFTKRVIPAEKIRAQNIPIFVPASMEKTDANLDTLFDDMLKLGAIFHVEDRAQQWVDGQKKDLAAVQKEIGNLPHKRVFIYDSSDGQPFTVFKGYTTNILKLIGADNVMEHADVDKTWATTSWESIVEADPDYIIITEYVGFRNEDDFQQKVDAFKNNPQLQNISAVRQNHFVRVRLSEITPGVRTVAALKRLAEEIHGITIQ